MRRGWLIVLLLLATAVAGYFAWCRRPAEPTFDGKPVSYWFHLYVTGETYGYLERDEAAEVLRLMGTNAVLYLAREAFDTRWDSPLARATWSVRAFARTNLHFGEGPLLSGDEIRDQAARALGELKPPAKLILPLLSEPLQRAGTTRRRAALSLLGCIGEGAEEGAPILAEALLDKDPWARRAALLALLRLGPKAKPALPSMIQALERDGYSPLLIPAVGNCGADARAALPLLQRWLAYTNAEARVPVAVAVCQIDPGQTQTLALVTQALSVDADSNLRNAALWALANVRTNGEVFVPGLVSLANGSSRSVATRAIYALQCVSPNAAGDYLVSRMQSDPRNEDVLWAAGTLLRRNPRHPQALSFLTAFLQPTNRDSQLRYYAVLLLAPASPEAPGTADVIRLLEAIAKDKQDTACEPAQTALRRILRRAGRPTSG